MGLLDCGCKGKRKQHKKLKENNIFVQNYDKTGMLNIFCKLLLMNFL